MKREAPVKGEEQEPPRKRRRVVQEEDDEKQPEGEEILPQANPQIVLDDSDEEEENEGLNIQIDFDAGDDAIELDADANVNYAPCAVMKIKMQYFRGMTELHIRPGPGTNFITGPNGSGKSSTLLALYAICGGKPDKIISGSTWDDWIMTDRDQAMVRVIFNKPEDVIVPSSRGCHGFRLTGPFAVSMKLRRGTHPKWQVNCCKTPRYAIMSHKNITTFMELLNIRWNNPCQFLPQEKVGSFANMHPKKRFEESLRTFQDGTLVTQHKMLVNLRKDSKIKQQELEVDLEKLKSQEQIQARIMKRLKKCRERMDLAKEKEALVAFRPWIERREMESEKEEFEALLEKYKEKMDGLEAQKMPFVNAVKESNDCLSEAKTRLKTIRQACKRAKDIIAETKEHMSKERRTLTLQTGQLRDQKKELDRNATNLAKARTELNEMMENKDNPSQAINKEELKKKMAEFHNKMIPVNKERTELGNELAKIRAEKTSIQRTRDHASRRMKEQEGRMKNASSACLRDPEVKKLHGLIENLKNQEDYFKGEVYGPIGVHLELTDTKFGKAVESKLGWKLNKGFLVSCKDDQDALRDLMKVNKIHKVNIYVQEKSNIPVVYSGDQDFIEQNGGVYLIDTVKAPQMIMDHLVQHGWAKAAIFPDEKECYDFLIKEQTTANSGYNAKRLIQAFNSTNYYTAKVSRYGKRHVSYVDSALEARGRLLGTSHIQEAYDRSAAVYNSQVDMLKDLAEKEAKMRKEWDEKNSAYNHYLGQYRKCQARLNSPHVYEKKMQQLRNKIKRLEAENLQRNIAMTERNIRSAALRLKKQIVKLGNETLNHSKRETYKQRFLFAKKAQEIRLKDAERKRDKFIRSIQNNQDAKSKEQVAYHGCCKKLERQKRIVTHNEEKFGELWKKHDCEVKYGKASIHEDKDRLEADINVLTRKLAQFVDDAASMMRTEEEFEKCEKKIKSVQRAIEFKKSIIAKIEDKRKKVEDTWLPSIRELTKNINGSFQEMTKIFKAEGRVSLVEDPERNYTNYQIKVEMSSLKEKDDRKLRSLSGGSHSGGEQSVATMTYILALQKVSQLPFRCVDEINQGMDATNERKIMTLVGELCAKAQNDGTHPPQMFIFSPNLLRNMNWGRYRHVMRFHVIMNGPHNVIGANDWRQDDFVKQTVDYLSQMSQLNL